MGQFLNNLPVLADAETVIFVIIVLFSFFGWIVKLIKSMTQQQPPELGGRGANAAPNQNRTLQHEIDQFLEKVVGKKPVEDDPVDAARIERRRQASQNRRKQQAKPQKPVVAATQQQKKADTRQGSSVAAHVQTYMSSNIDAGVQSHLQRLQPTMGHRSSALTGTGALSVDNEDAEHTIGGDMLAFLSNPASMRQAILLNEILSPPKSLRNRSGH